MTTEILDIQDAYKRMYASSIVITEEVHKDIQSIMDADKPAATKK